MQLSLADSLHIKPISTKAIWSVGVALLVLIVPFFQPTVPDPDLWGHLRFGLDILQSHNITQIDPYSYLTAGQHWIRQEWLSEVLFALAYSAIGPAGLGLLKLLVNAAILGLSYRYLYTRGMPALQAAVLVLLAFLSLYQGTTMVRPQLFTYLFLLLVVLALVSAEHGQWRWLWLLPPLFALWANLHGGFLAGLAILLAWAIFHLIHNRSHFWPVCPVLLLSILATLINPIGPDLPVSLLRVILASKPEMIDWQPLQMASSSGVAYLILLAVASSSLLLTHRPRSISLVGPFCILAIVPLVAVRNLPLFAVATPILIGEHMADAWAKPFARITSKNYSPVMAILPLLTAIGLGITASGNIGVDQLDKRIKVYPAAAVAMLKASGAAGNLVVHYDWGEYVIWHLGPRVRVSMDGRREVLYGDDTQRANLQFEYGMGNWDAVLTQYPTDMALVSRDFAAYNLMRLKPGWVSVYEDAVAAIFVPQGSPLVDKFRQIARSTLPPDGDGLNFP